jgi:hypothetical protein
VVFTAAIAIASFWQGRILKRSIQLAREEFISTNRPKVRVRNIDLPIPRSPWKQGDPPPEGVWVTGHLYVVNVGNSRARIIDSGCWVIERNGGLPMRRPYEGKSGTGVVKPCTLAPGQEALGDIKGDTPLAMGARGILIGAANLYLWVMGWIAYVDDLDTPRRTYFCRVYKANTDTGGSYVAVANPDYEAED